MPAEHHHGADFDKCHPGKAGVSRYHLKRNLSFSPTVNVDKLQTLVSEQTRRHCQEQDCGAPIVDVVRPGLLQNSREGRAPREACHGEGRSLQQKN